jgi:hypothetical protein
LVGQFKTYKKLFGLFRVRTKKGETYDEYTIYDGEILKHREVQIIYRHYGDDFQSEEYYYINNKLVKYKRTVDKRTKEGTRPKEMARIYIDKERILSADGKIERRTLTYLQAHAKRDIEMKWD